MTNSSRYLTCYYLLPVTPVDCVNVENKDMTMNEEENANSNKIFS